MDAHQPHMSTSTAPMSTMEAELATSTELPAPDGVETFATQSTAAPPDSPSAAPPQLPDKTTPSDVSSDSNTIGGDIPTAAPRSRPCSVAGSKQERRTVRFDVEESSEDSRPVTPNKQPLLPDPLITSPTMLPPLVIPEPPPPIVYSAPPPPMLPPPPLEPAPEPASEPAPQPAPEPELAPEPASKPAPELNFEDDNMEPTPSDNITPSDIDMELSTSTFAPPPQPPPPPPPPPPPDFAPEPDTQSVTMAEAPPPPPPPPGPPQPLDMTYTMIISSNDPQLPRINPQAQKIYDRFMNDLSKFVQMQADVTRLRVQVQEKRTELRILRQRVSDSDRIFMDALRVSWINKTTSDDPSLESLYQTAQEARDLAGPSEADYEEMENQLGASEFALKEQYEEVQRKFDHFFKLQIGTTTIQTHASDISFESATSISSAREGEPRNKAMLDGTYLGDAVKIGQVPHRSHLPPEPPSHTTASNPHDSSAFPDAIRRSTVLTAEDVPKSIPGDEHIPFELTVPDLNSPNLSGLADELPENLRGIGELATIFEGDPIPTEDENIWGDGHDMLLLGTDDSSQSTLSDYLRDFTSTRERINMWLLHKLRISPWEMYELERSVLSEHGERIPSWAKMALDVWKTDPATKDLGYGPDSISQDSLELQPAVLPPMPVPYPPPPDRRKTKRVKQTYTGDKSEPVHTSKTDFGITKMAVRPRVTFE